MDVDAALDLAEALVTAQTGKARSDLQRAIFRGALEKKSYYQIVKDCNCNLSYAKEVVSEWCKVLTSALGEPVEKKNVVRLLERRVQSGAVPQSQQTDKAQEANGHIPQNGSGPDLGQTVEATTSQVSDAVKPEGGNTNTHSARRETASGSPPAPSDGDSKHQRGVWIPDPRCRIVWGRDLLIEKVLHRLTDPQELPILSLSGGAGYGKTEAAGQVAKAALQKNLFADVLWVTARQTELVDGHITESDRLEALNWNQFLNQIAHQLACPVERVRQRLREEKLLVVLDNAETSQVEEILANLVKMLSPSRALLTSRLKTKPPYVGLIQISGLEEQWSHRLLRDEAVHNSIPVLIEASDNQLHRVHELSCGAPLALHFIVGRVLDDGALEPVLSALEQASGEVEVFYQFSLETAWRRISDAAKSVLRYMGRADAGVPSAELFGAGGVQESDWNKARRELKRWYLIEDVQDALGNQRYDLHPWVRRSLRAGLVDNWQPSLQDLEQIAKWKLDIDI